ncbi:hypothetical protein LSH36_308g02007 [Paralvinella palmiformis]|uniref:Uncharacterized protein n=1 Tax=Paralvinella palmiformis TaxID=53620 RepID=A0AAD9JIK0_9ANNE|nr:hypothetical protein LSH36_308g02007 [Paralvinella palmiformis]
MTLSDNINVKVDLDIVCKCSFLKPEPRMSWRQPLTVPQMLNPVDKGFRLTEQLHGDFEDWRVVDKPLQ